MIDTLRGVLTLPASENEEFSPTVPLADLGGVEVYEEVTKDSDGDEKRAYLTLLTTHEGWKFRAASWSDRKDAELLRDWLAERLDLTPSI